MADNSYTQLSIPLARSSQNFAPRGPIEDFLRRKGAPNKQPTKFEAAIKQKYDQYMAYEMAAWNEIISVNHLVSLFREGQQIGIFRRPFGQPGYYVRPIANDDSYRQTAMNMMGFYSQVCESKVLSSNPTVNMRAGDDTPESIRAAQNCRPVVDKYETEWYTNKFSRREAIRLLNDGLFIHRVRWNPFKGGHTVQERQVNQQQQQTDQGYGECAECSYAGAAADFSADVCPECGSQAIDVKPPTTINLAAISMGPARPIGEPEIISTPFAAWRWDLSKDLEESSWAIYRQRVTPGTLAMMLGDSVVPDSSSSDDRGLDVLHNLAYAGQAFQGQSGMWRYGYGREYDRRPTMAEFWMSPEDYADIPIEAGETVSGQTLPAGLLGQFFKDPICAVGLNDFALTLGVYANETQQSEVVTGPWIMRAESGAGRGLVDATGTQKRFNAVDGHIYKGLAGTATPTVVTDMRILREDQAGYLFRPETNLDVNLSLLPPNMRLQDAFYLGAPGAVNQQYIQYGMKFLKDMADIQSFAVEYSEVLSIDNRTATGAQLTAALANSLYGPMLGSKGQSRVRIAEMIVCLEAAHNPTARFYPGKGNARGRMVSGRDLKAGKVIFDLVQNSILPVTPFSQQTDIRVFGEAFGGLLGAAQLKEAFPAFFKAVSAPFNIKFEAEDDDYVSTLCLGRMEQMKQNLMAGIDDPALLVQMLQPPISQYEPKHKEKKQWYSDWLDLQSAQESPMELREAAEQAYLTHQNFETQLRIPQAMNEGMVQAAAQAPMAVGAAALGGGGEGGPDQGSTQTHEAEMAAQDRKLDAATELASQQHEAEMKDKEIAGQLAVTQAQGKNQLEATRLAGKNQIAAVKAKPKSVARSA